MPYVAVSVYSYLLKPKTAPLRAEKHPCFVKIIRKKNTNFALALRKRRGFCVTKKHPIAWKDTLCGMQNNRFCKALIARRLCNNCICKKYLHLCCILFVYRIT